MKLIFTSVEKTKGGFHFFRRHNVP